MNIKMDLNQTTTPRKNKCWEAYHAVFNNKMCNRIMVILFCIVLIIFFFALVAFTYVKLNSRANIDDDKSETPTIEHSSMNDFGINSFDATNNCMIDNCDVKCQGIDADSMMTYFNQFYADPGFDCADITLVVENCSFSSNTLSNKWLLNNEVKIERLEFIQCNIEFIETSAFDSRIFEETKELTINQLRIVYLRYDAFAGLNSLQTLNIIKIPLAKSEPKILEPMAGSLTKLVLQEIGNDSSSNHFIPNDFTGSTPLSNLKSLTLRYNNMKSLNFSSFSGVKALGELNLANSKIEFLDLNTFDFASSTLRTIQLQNNLLKTLPVGIFDNLQLGVEKIKINLKNNLWHCDCNLIHLQNKILDYPGVFQEETKCLTPDNFKDVNIKEVDLCPNTDEPTDTTPLITSSSTAGSVETTKRSGTIPGVRTSASTEEFTDEECFPPVTSTDPTCNPRPDSTTTKTSTTPATTTTEEATTTTTTATTTTTTTQSVPITSTSPLTSSERTTLTTQSTTSYNTTVPLTTTTTTTRTVPVETSTAPPTQPTTSGTSTQPPLLTTLDIKCLRESIRILVPPKSNVQNLSSITIPLLPRFIPNESFDIFIPRPLIVFDVHDVNENEVIVHFDDVYYRNDNVLIYYPGVFNASDMTISEGQIEDVLRCQLIYSYDLKIKNLQSSLIYTFCVIQWNSMILTPFHCRSHQTQTPFGRQPWIVQEHKVIILTSFLVLILVALLIGITMTYLLIRRVPTLMRGSKRVVMVNNRTKDVMVLPSDSRNGSCHKDPPMPAFTEASNYMTPLPRHNFDQRPPLVRSSSDMSLRSARSYVTVNPPRFSQVFEPSDFRQELPRRCGSYPCQSPPPLPPHPNHRRSIVSTTSTAEIGKGLQFRNNHNHSVYKRQPSRIAQEDETENHYNFII